jgi:translation initiation factor 2 alpha subunit (eIF-2alpha)
MATMTQHRFYRAELPEVDEIVAAEISRIDDNAVYCTLPAYAGVEAMLPTTEVGVKRGKRVVDYVRVGQLLPLAVIRVVGTNIDVSLKQCREEEGKAAMERYHKDARVDLILRTAAAQDPGKTTELYSTVVWPMRDQEEDVHNQFEEARIAMEDGAPTRSELTAELLAAIKAKMPPVTYTADREILLRFGTFHDGVERLRAALTELAAKEAIDVFVVAPPKYRVTAKDRTPARAASRLEAALTGLPTPC